jgi:hypothetical protein
MSACYRLVLDAVCRSNHHRIAVMALEHLQSDDAVGWRDLFLKHRDAYLEGAKAPDEVFKDFRNHVLHVRDGDWGGAPAAAREWYRRTVRAMQAQDWKHAAYCAGVMSHYVADPVQPFHTHQTEEENTVHRAPSNGRYRKPSPSFFSSSHRISVFRMCRRPTETTGLSRWSAMARLSPTSITRP